MAEGEAGLVGRDLGRRSSADGGGSYGGESDCGFSGFNVLTTWSGKGQRRQMRLRRSAEDELSFPVT